MIVTRIQVKYCFLSSVLLFYLYLTQSITVQTISGTGSLRIGANFLVCELFFLLANAVQSLIFSHINHCH